MLKTIILVLLTGAVLTAGETESNFNGKEEAYKVPFSSTGNEIELTVANSSLMPLIDVKVKVVNAPDWIKFNSNEMNISELKGQEEAAALFSFSVDKAAPVGKETVLNFQIISKDGNQWNKEIKIKVGAPEKFELFRNYPNPFNPVTVISYQLSVSSKVDLRIFNVLGQEVFTLVNETQEPGYYPYSWNAAGNSSGMYIYQVDVQGIDGQRHVERKKMMLLK